MKLIIAGGRKFGWTLDSRKRPVPNQAHIDLAYKSLGDLCDLEGPPIEVVSGGAHGADSIGEMWAHQHGIPVKIFPADWENQGRKAGILRNIEMGDYADYLIAFWDGKSKGTHHMISYMKRLDKPVQVVVY